MLRLRLETRRRGGRERAQLRDFCQPKPEISETKRFADVASLPPDFEIAPEWDVCFASIMRPAAQERIRKLMERGFHQAGDVETRLGYYVGQLGR